MRGSLRAVRGYIVGRHIELVPHELIVQAWRVGNWNRGVYSLVRFELLDLSPGTRIVFDHTGFPPATPRTCGRLACALLGPAREDSRGRMNQPQTLGTRGNAMNSQLRHIVIIVKENHTFDNYFGTFPAANGAALSKAANYYSEVAGPSTPNH